MSFQYPQDAFSKRNDVNSQNDEAQAPQDDEGYLQSFPRVSAKRIARESPPKLFYRSLDISSWTF